jgi:hypothetical protein
MGGSRPTARASRYTVSDIEALMKFTDIEAELYKLRSSFCPDGELFASK